MDDVPICPDWWPAVLWRLHFPVPGVHGPKGGPGGPVNYPPILNEIFAGLSMHTFSYLLSDQKAAQQMRDSLETQIASQIKQLSVAHNKGNR
ncbi:MAG TPA: hypothetical protein VM008_17705 [Phycisphaerae bacterium]|nr:hypothetical protein [Phycisphaerae bacterium]